MHLRPGFTLDNGKYRIVRFISSGGFGCTYEAVHATFNERFAIKEFFQKSYCSRNPETGYVSIESTEHAPLVNKMRKRFIDEAKTIFQLQKKARSHGIINVTDVFEENGTAYYVMDYIDGRTLKSIIDERGVMPEAEALQYICKVCDSLKEVHRLRQLHLDIKPGNIMVDKSGQPILIDFGASLRFADGQANNPASLVGVYTNGYSPIEQQSNSLNKLSPETDIYALGATLYKLVTGKTPPEASIVASSGLDMPEYLSPNIKRCIRKAMSKLRDDRYRNVTEFKKALLNPDNNENSSESVVLGFEIPGQKNSVNKKPQSAKKPQPVNSGNYNPRQTRQRIGENSNQRANNSGAPLYNPKLTQGAVNPQRHQPNPRPYVQPPNSVDRNGGLKWLIIMLAVIIAIGLTVCCWALLSN